MRRIQATISPSVAAILNITPNHLDRHGTLEAYAAAKQRLRGLVIHLIAVCLMGGAALAEEAGRGATQITANIFDRGWLETAYYYYGSDYRGDMGDDYVVTYMSQEGGWGAVGWDWAETV